MEGGDGQRGHVQRRPIRGRKRLPVAKKRQPLRPPPVFSGGRLADRQLGLAADDRIDARAGEHFLRPNRAVKAEQEHGRAAAAEPLRHGQHRPQLQRRTLPAVQRGTGDADQVGLAGAGGDLFRREPLRLGVDQADAMAVALQQGGAVQKLQRRPTAVVRVVRAADRVLPTWFDENNFHQGVFSLPIHGPPLPPGEVGVRAELLSNAALTLALSRRERGRLAALADEFAKVQLPDRYSERAFRNSTACGRPLSNRRHLSRRRRACSSRPRRWAIVASPK